MSIFDRLFGRKDNRMSVAAAAAEKESPVRNLAADLPDEETAVAVATAAIAASRGEERCAFNVISITKIYK